LLTESDFLRRSAPVAASDGTRNVRRMRGEPAGVKDLACIQLGREVKVESAVSWSTPWRARIVPDKIMALRVRRASCLGLVESAVNSATSESARMSEPRFTTASAWPSLMSAVVRRVERVKRKMGYSRGFRRRGRDLDLMI